MDLYQLSSPAEAQLAFKADVHRIPLGGTMELTPLCNMKCKICYIRQNPDEITKEGRLLTYDEWIKIATEAKEAGVLYLLLTGGEPLIYPDFKRLYSSLTEMGFIITINTNGTLIDEEWADFFAERPCRRLNISIYGKDNETYKRLCNNATGFSQLENALRLLDERNIMYRLNHTVTKDNMSQLHSICNFALSKNVPLEAVSYLFPPFRCSNNSFSRLSPKEAAQAKFNKHLYLDGPAWTQMYASNLLNNMHTTRLYDYMEGMTCRAGRSGFWISWNGNLLPCGMFTNPKISLLTNSFADAWNFITAETDKLRYHSGCKSCDKRHICNVCAAVCLTESGGDMCKKPEYVCELTENFYKLLLNASHSSPMEQT